MSIRELQDDFKIIKPQLEEILRLLNKIQANNIPGNIEAAAAKIITELKSTIQDCRCNKEQQIIITNDDHSSTSTPWRYSYPNFSVGNEELGTGKNPGSLTWPFGTNNKKLE